MVKNILKGCDTESHFSVSVNMYNMEESFVLATSDLFAKWIPHENESYHVIKVYDNVTIHFTQFFDCVFCFRQEIHFESIKKVSFNYMF